MELIVIGTGSKGNGYILNGEKEALVIECGCRYSEVMKAIAHDRKKVVGCLVTHEHGDHAKYAKQYLDNGLEVYATAGTLTAISYDGVFAPKVCTMYDTFHCGGFEVTAFPTKHDARMPCGYHIWHHDMGSLVFATDTVSIDATFLPMDHIMIECDYTEEALSRNTRLPDEVKDRIRQSHLSLGGCVEELMKMDLRACKDIVLVHMSDDNSEEALMVEAVRNATGKPTYAAAKGMTIEYGIVPF